MEFIIIGILLLLISSFYLMLKSYIEYSFIKKLKEKELLDTGIEPSNSDLKSGMCIKNGEPKETKSLSDQWHKRLSE